MFVVFAEISPALIVAMTLVLAEKYGYYLNHIYGHEFWKLKRNNSTSCKALIPCSVLAILVRSLSSSSFVLVLFLFFLNNLVSNYL